MDKRVFSKNCIKDVNFLETKNSISIKIMLLKFVHIFKDLNVVIFIIFMMHIKYFKKVVKSRDYHGIILIIF